MFNDVPVDGECGIPLVVLLVVHTECVPGVNGTGVNGDGGFQIVDGAWVVLCQVKQTDLEVCSEVVGEVLCGFHEVPDGFCGIAFFFGDHSEVEEGGCESFVVFECLEQCLFCFVVLLEDEVDSAFEEVGFHEVGVESVGFFQVEECALEVLCFKVDFCPEVVGFGECRV